MDDLISKQVAIDALFELYEYQRDIDPTEAADLVRQGIYLAEKKVEQLPSAERKGKWIMIDNNKAECSECGEIRKTIGHDFSMKGYIFYGFYRYCPECGARMEP